MLLLLPLFGTAALGAPPVTFLADLPDDVLAKMDPSSPTAASGVYGLLDAALRASEAYRFRPGPIEIYTDPRWFSSLPGSDSGAPFLVLRRWPGDTALAFYALAGGKSDEEGNDSAAGPVFASARWEKIGNDTAGWTWWQGVLESAQGEHPARWAELDVPDTAFRLGALLLPGDAGLGEAAVESLYLELRYVLGQTRLNPEGWGVAEVHPAGTVLVPPALSQPPGPADEGLDPWQVIRATGFTLGLPPGLRARRTDAGYEVPRPVPGGRLWFRGRFVDRDENEIVIGDARRAGYVAVRAEGVREWYEGDSPPVAVAGAERMARIDYEVAAEFAGATHASAERWSEPGFEGQWLLFRLRFENRGVEIGIPVVRGRRSEALFWMPVTFRDQGRPPAPPPVDAAKRFGIRFEQFQGAFRRQHPWSEGFLEVPGLRLEIPRDWWPMASLRSRDGFPVRFLDDGGEVVGRLLSLGVDPKAEPSEGEGWAAIKKPGRHRATAAYRSSDGTYVFRSKSGHVFRLEPVSAESGAREAWVRLAESAEMVSRGR